MSAAAASSGVSFTRYDACYGIAGGRTSRIDMEQDKVQSRGEWRVNGAGIEAIRYWFGMSDYQHNEIDRMRPATSARCSLNKEYEGRVEVQHLPVKTAFGELRGAVGTQFGQRKVTALRVSKAAIRCSSPARPTAWRPSGSRSCRSPSACGCRRPRASSKPRLEASGLD